MTPVIINIIFTFKRLFSFFSFIKPYTTFGFLHSVLFEVRIFFLGRGDLLSLLSIRLLLFFCSLLSISFLLTDFSDAHLDLVFSPSGKELTVESQLLWG